jgi:hypothetical protein
MFWRNMLRASFWFKEVAAILKMEAVHSLKYVVLPFWTAHCSTNQVTVNPQRLYIFSLPGEINYILLYVVSSVKDKTRK